MAQAPRKKLVICADDYGMSEAINQAVLQLAQLGRLNATSCLVGGPALRESGIQIGLHLNFTEKLAASQGIYLPIGSLIRACWLRRLGPQQVRAQIHAQFDRFEQVMGRQPDFVDGHQHVHQFPVIRTQLLAVLHQRSGDHKPWLRSTRAPTLAGIPVAQRLKAKVVQALGGGKLSALAQVGGYPMNARFLGVYDFQGGQTSYLGYLDAWLRNAVSGDLLMCHPAARHDPADTLGQQRLAEFTVLASDAAGLLYQQAGIDLHSSDSQTHRRSA